MLRAHLLVAIAWIFKQPFYYLIKVAGLAIGIMCMALCIGYVAYMDSYDSHIENRANTYRIVGEFRSAETGALIRPEIGSNAWVEPLRNEYAGAYAKFGVALRRSGVFSYEESSFDQEYYVAEQDILDILGVELLNGNPATALVGPNKVMLSESTAAKYFARGEEILGKAITLDGMHFLEVTGIFRDQPDNSNFPMEAILSYESVRTLLRANLFDNNNWMVFNGFRVFVSFASKANADAVNDDLAAFILRRVPEQNLAAVQRSQLKLRLQPLSEIYLDPLTGGFNGDDFTRKNTYLGISVLAFLVMLGACVNHVSLTLAQLRLRAKELGLRVSLGATKTTLTLQFFLESLIVSVPALLLSLGLVLVFLPIFSAMVSVQMSNSEILKAELWGTIALVVFVVCLATSVAPIVLQKVTAVMERQKRHRLKGGGMITFFQFAVTTLSALVVLGIYLQIDFLQRTSLGLNPRNVVTLDTRYDGRQASSVNFEALQNELLEIPGVESQAAVSIVPPTLVNYTNWRRTNTGGDDLEVAASHIVVAPEFLSTYQIELVAGRNFSSEFPADLLSKDASADTFGIMMTESGIERFGIASPAEAIGQTFRSVLDQGERTYIVIGVVKNFKFVPSESAGRSVAIMQGTIEPLRTIVLRLGENHGPATLGEIENTWKKFLPATPLSITYMEEVIRGDIRDKTEGLALAALAAAAIFLSTAIFGIYAQATAICEQYAKAIAIRKILGGSVAAIVSTLITQFLLPVMLSFVLAIPLAMYAIGKFYSSFQSTAGYPLTWYACCLLGTMVLAAMTVFSNSYRVATRHPINSLRYE